MTYTPAEIVAAFIVAQGLGIRPSVAGDWRTTIGFMSAELPDKRIGTYDLGAEIQGKQHTGDRVQKPNVQIRTRAIDYRDAFVKLEAILTALSNANHVALTVNSEPVTLIAATVTQDVTWIGQEEKSTRQLCSAVVKLSIR